MSQEKLMYSLTELLVTVEKNEGKDKARFIRDKITQDLVKQKRTAVKIAAAAYGSVMALEYKYIIEQDTLEDIEDNTDAGSKVIEDAIWQSQKFYQQFSAKWIQYCTHFWTRHHYEEDGLSLLGFD